MASLKASRAAATKSAPSSSRTVPPPLAPARSRPAPPPPSATARSRPAPPPPSATARSRPATSGTASSRHVRTSQASSNKAANPTRASQRIRQNSGKGGGK
ncbi:hypothetical protein RchiOBHm_Chr6g0264991 [Rosa chinensis]|uniref:Uncharacterized protein n=1 Tax=Rosa chinensis TaxID=74649 RepID=A0A2P6PPC7_ROSCH|nr:hypothetical protein RchiOBHm_Chr6g0264991 [Rosa chinensis]